MWCDCSGSGFSALRGYSGHACATWIVRSEVWYYCILHECRNMRWWLMYCLAACLCDSIVVVVVVGGMYMYRWIRGRRVINYPMVTLTASYGIRMSSVTLSFASYLNPAIPTFDRPAAAASYSHLHQVSSIDSIQIHADIETRQGLHYYNRQIKFHSL